MYIFQRSLTPLGYIYLVYEYNIYEHGAKPLPQTIVNLQIQPEQHVVGIIWSGGTGDPGSPHV